MEQIKKYIEQTRQQRQHPSWDDILHILSLAAGNDEHETETTETTETTEPHFSL